MTIERIGSGVLRPLGSKSEKVSDDQGKGQDNGSAGRSDRSDSVGISEAGLAFAAKASEVEARIASGVYDDPAMVEEVARRILDSGALDVDV